MAEGEHGAQEPATLVNGLPPRSSLSQGLVVDSLLKTNMSRRTLLKGAAGGALGGFGILRSVNAEGFNINNSAAEAALEEKLRVSEDELRSFWERAGFEFQFPQDGLHAAPALELRNNDDKPLIHLASADNPEEGFPNFALATPLYSGNNGARYFHSQAEFVATSEHIIETSEGRLVGVFIHGRWFWGDFDKGIVRQKVVPFFAGWKGNGTFNPLPVSFNDIQDLGKTRPSIQFTGGRFIPPDQVASKLNAEEYPIIMQMQTGVDYDFDPNAPQIARKQYGLQGDFFDPVVTKANSDYHEELHGTAEDVTYAVAQEQGNKMYEPGRDAFEITETEVSDEPIEKKLDKIPDSASVLNRNSFTVRELAQYPRAPLIRAFRVNLKQD